MGNPEYSRNYYLQHREEKKKYSKRYYREHKSEYKQYINRPEVKRRIKRYRKLVNQNEKVKKYLVSIRLKLIEFLGSKCCKCGIDDIRMLEIDHINGNGFKKNKRFTNTYCEHLYYLKRPEKAKITFQILCGNCHNIKTYEERRRTKQL